MSEVVCLGIFVADALGRPIDRFPEFGRLVLFDQLELHTGGCASNTAIGLAKLGVEVATIGRVGEDEFGDFILGHLEKCGINTTGMKRDKDASTSFTFVSIASDGERAFLHTLGANAHFSLEDVDMDRVKGAKILHIAGTFLMPKIDGEPTARLLKEAKAAGVITSLDTAYNDRLPDWLSVLAPSLPFMDYFLPSVEEARRVSGLREPEEVARFFLDRGVKVVGLKMGLDGAYVASKDEEVRVPIYQVETVDTTGAGDAFAAGFLQGVLEEWPLKECAKLGNAVAALVVGAIGTSAGLKTFEETLKVKEEWERCTL